MAGFDWWVSPSETAHFWIERVLVCGYQHSVVNVAPDIGVPKAGGWRMSEMTRILRGLPKLNVV